MTTIIAHIDCKGMPRIPAGHPTHSTSGSAAEASRHPHGVPRILHRNIREHQMPTPKKVEFGPPVLRLLVENLMVLNDGPRATAVDTP